MSDEKLDVFNVLNFLNNGYELEHIINEGNFKTFNSTESCIEYLTNQGYLEPSSNPSNDNLVDIEDLFKHTVSELKEMLREHNLKVSGKKQELIERLHPVLNKHNINTENTSSEEIKLTKKANDFLKENEWIDLYMFALVVFSFEDCENYFENSNQDTFETALNFCDEIISRALISNKFLVFIEGLSAKSHVYAYYDDYESFLDYDLQRYILSLNPISLTHEEYSNYVVINEANIINLKNVIDKFDFGNLKKKFNKIWNKSHITDITVPKKISYKYLLKAFDGADIDELNFDLKEKYFNKKFGL
ncbi:MAG: hypothetical protein E7Z80_02020 [Methanobrevibacter thaueri]|nr:hypothetical protein [Methanobrevibacter thaueri]